MMIEVHTQSASFRKGWVAGFYDAKSDEGVRYVDELLRYGIRTHEQREFIDGYRTGQRLRLGEPAALSHGFKANMATAA